MLSLPDYHAMLAALAQPMEPTLHRLLTDRVADTIACGLEHMTHLIVVEPGDGEADFLREAGLSPFHNPLSDARYGNAGFEPHWDWAGYQDGWFEWFTTIGNDGFAFVVLVPDREGIDPDLLTLLRGAVVKAAGIDSDPSSPPACPTAAGSDRNRGDRV